MSAPGIRGLGFRLPHALRALLPTQAIENIRTEIEVMKKVHHPNCISLHNVYESANHIYLVMELVCAGGERAHTHKGEGADA